jgi:hypothetical protein
MDCLIYRRSHALRGISAYHHIGTLHVGIKTTIEHHDDFNVAFCVFPYIINGLLKMWVLARRYDDGC